MRTCASAYIDLEHDRAFHPLAIRDARCATRARSSFASVRSYWHLGKRACTSSTGHLVRRRCLPLATTPLDMRPALLGSSTSMGCSLAIPRFTSTTQSRFAIPSRSIPCSHTGSHTPVRSILIFRAALVIANVARRKAVRGVSSRSYLAGRDCAGSRQARQWSMAFCHQ